MRAADAGGAISRWDVLGIGAAAVDDVLYIDAYPAPDAKVAVRRRDRGLGGLSAVAVAAAARVGVRAGYVGTLGTDPDSDFALERLREAGVDVSAAARRSEARVIRSMVVVDRRHATRTIFFDVSGVRGVTPEWPPEEAIISTRVLLIDDAGRGGMLHAARLARRAGVPTVADFEHGSAPHFGELLEVADHVILSRAFAQQITGRADPASATAALWTATRDTVVVTCGGDGCWWQTAGRPSPAHQRSLAVRATETTGCGDVFHGAYAAALSLGMPAEPRVRFATAAAGLRAAAASRREPYPSRADVDAALARL